MDRKTAKQIMDTMRLREIAHTVRDGVDDMQRIADIAHDLGYHDLEGQIRAARAGLLAVASHEAIASYVGLDESRRVSVMEAVEVNRV